MTDIGMGVFELLEQDARAWYRVIYYTRLKGKIVVLHCFEKKTNKTNINDIELAKKRLKEILKGR
jgi:phage-related protein